MNHLALLHMRKMRREWMKQIREEEKLPAPEKAVKLLLEMEDAARKLIIAKGEVRNNLYGGVYVAYADQLQTSLTEKITLYVRFRLNGQEINLKRDVAYDRLKKTRFHKFKGSNLEIRNEAELFIAEYIVDQLSKDVIEEIYKIKLPQ